MSYLHNDKQALFQFSSDLSFFFTNSTVFNIPIRTEHPPLLSERNLSLSFYLLCFFSQFYTVYSGLCTSQNGKILTQNVLLGVKTSTSKP